MPKNIIVCADGTGNKGGYTPDSNVFKIYKSVDTNIKAEAQGRFTVDEQIVFYDNGVGTNKNKYIRLIGGAFGLGFEDNVCDLYKFLARNYARGDRIYFFGFSRGASTVRACNGFIRVCGLAKGRDLSNRRLEELVQEAFEAYKVYKTDQGKADALKQSDRSHGVVPIHYIGIWDTVVALGFPKRTDITGPVSAGLNALFWLVEKGLDLLWPHSFYNYKLTDNVVNAYQALAIDDERTAFWPFIWQENDNEADTVEQVWFAGMHSNVGGGYARSGLASVALYWMMLRAQNCGLVFNDDALTKAYDDSHFHGRMYNSRDGFAVFYRYHPREIEKLCAGRLRGNIKLHRSVVERINHRTANYAPGQIPGKFEVVGSEIGATPEIKNPGTNPTWKTTRSEIDQWVLKRKGLYAAMLTFSLSIILSAGWFVIHPPQPKNQVGFWRDLASRLDGVLPDFFNGLIEFVVVQHSYLFIGMVGFLAAYLAARWWCRRKTVKACERLRKLIMREDSGNASKQHGNTAIPLATQSGAET